MVSSQTDLLIQTVNNEATRLGDFLTGLYEQMWTRDSACESWVIGDVVAHLAGGRRHLGQLHNSGSGWRLRPPGGTGFYGPRPARL